MTLPLDCKPVLKPEFYERLLDFGDLSFLEMTRECQILQEAFNCCPDRLQPYDPPPGLTPDESTQTVSDHHALWSRDPVYALRSHCLTETDRERDFRLWVEYLDGDEDRDSDDEDTDPPANFESFTSSQIVQFNLKMKKSKYFVRDPEMHVADSGPWWQSTRVRVRPLDVSVLAKDEKFLKTIESALADLPEMRRLPQYKCLEIEAQHAGEAALLNALTLPGKGKLDAPRFHYVVLRYGFETIWEILMDRKHQFRPAAVDFLTDEWSLLADDPSYFTGYSKVDLACRQVVFHLSDERKGIADARLPSYMPIAAQRIKDIVKKYFSMRSENMLPMLRSMAPRMEAEMLPDSNRTQSNGAEIARRTDSQELANRKAVRNIMSVFFGREHRSIMTKLDSPSDPDEFEENWGRLHSALRSAMDDATQVPSMDTVLDAIPQDEDPLIQAAGYVAEFSIRHQTTSIVAESVERLLRQHMPQ